MLVNNILAGQTIVVWFSCGAASAVAAHETLKRFGNDHLVRIVNNPVIEEDEDNTRFMYDVADWLGQEIEVSVNSKYEKCSAVEVWEKRRYMSGPKGAPCTLELKKTARYQWERVNSPDWHVLGFTNDEVRRHKNFVLNERPNVIPVLIDAGISKADCFKVLSANKITPPRVYKQGYPNANCIGCVKASSATYWNHVRVTHPDIFKHRCEMSRRLGARLVWYKGRRIFLDELPASAKGRPMKSMSIECGIFCEERV